MVQLPVCATDLATDSEANSKPLRRVSFADDLSTDVKHHADAADKRSVHSTAPGACSAKSIRLVCSSASATAGGDAECGRTISSSTCKVLRCGMAADKGRRHSMEDAHVIVDSLEGSVAGGAAGGRTAGLAVPTALLAVSPALKSADNRLDLV